MVGLWPIREEDFYFFLDFPTAREIYHLISKKVKAKEGRRRDYSLFGYSLAMVPLSEVRSWCFPVRIAS